MVSALTAGETADFATAAALDVVDMTAGVVEGFAGLLWIVTVSDGLTCFGVFEGLVSKLSLRLI